ncbi:MAG TPA: hypothetical protein VKQ11_22905 [Candidatus Sulfotelmatobacter sp.]|nr:hypothetical protein [Candidatus Sulfotelmatobacter sp.]
MKDVIRTDAELAAYSSEHLRYELQMLSYTANELSRMQNPSPQASALLESFCLHLRNLIEFFFTKPGDEKDDDVIAHDFCPRWSEKISPLLDKAAVRANKEVTHLTLQRKSGFDPAKPWNTVALFNEITAVANRFVDRADDAKLSAEVSNWLTSHHNLHTPIRVGVSITTSNTTATMIVSPPVKATEGP